MIRQSFQNIKKIECKILFCLLKLNLIYIPKYCTNFEKEFSTISIQKPFEIQLFIKMLNQTFLKFNYFLELSSQIYLVNDS